MSLFLESRARQLTLSISYLTLAANERTWPACVHVWAFGAGVGEEECWEEHALSLVFLKPGMITDAVHTSLDFFFFENHSE